MAIAKTARKKKTPAKVSKNVKKYVKRAIRSDNENKVDPAYISFAVGSTATNWNGSLNNVSAMAQGPALGQRIGDQIRVNHINLRYCMRFAQGVATIATQCRVLLVADKEQHGGVVPPVDSLLDATAQGTLNMPNAGWGVQQVANHRYHILYDRQFTLDASKQYSHSEAIKLFGKNKPATISYVGTGSTQADCGKNTLYLVLMSSTDSTSTPSFHGSVEINYEDS